MTNGTMMAVTGGSLAGRGAAADFGRWGTTRGAMLVRPAMHTDSAQARSMTSHESGVTRPTRSVSERSPP